MQRKMPPKKTRVTTEGRGGVADPAEETTASCGAPKKKPGQKNRYAGILQPRQVGTGAPEVSVVVLYDVEDDRIRARVSDICLNYGLERIQYSAFLGKINRNRRQELSLRLQEEVGAEQARLRIIPVTEDALKEMWVHDQYSRKGPALEAGGVVRIKVVAREE